MSQENLIEEEITTNNKENENKEKPVPQSESLQLQIKALERLYQQLANTEPEQKTSSFTLILKEKINQLGSSALTAIIALIAAIITPIILNSQFAKDINASISDIRSKLPNEADAIIVKELSSITSDHQSIINELIKKQQSIILDNKMLTDVKNDFETQYNQVLNSVEQFEIKSDIQNNSVDSLKSTIFNLEKKMADLQQQIQASKQTNSINKNLYHHLEKLYKDGESLTNANPTKAENWFKQLNYTIQGLQVNQTNDYLKLHVKTLNSIILKTDNFTDFSSRKSEALVILRSLLSLVDAAILK
ncbi:hypothetical protein [Aliikangiella sp. IMCC44359]|uniref:hypothetical protein n=1 Tax=Aliikangiella sp. IMCC44359 TaxID=3459125 RepID=UPI00403ABF3C